MNATANKLDPSAEGKAENLGIRFTQDLLTYIDAEARRLTDVTGERFDRSKAVRSIVRRMMLADRERGTFRPGPVVALAPEPREAPRAPDHRKQAGSTGAARRWGQPVDEAQARALVERLACILSDESVSVRSIALAAKVSPNTLHRALRAVENGSTPSVSEQSHKAITEWLDTTTTHHNH